MKRKTLLLLMLSLFFCVGFSFAQGAFMKIGSIKGEAKDSKHKDWINIESLSYAMTKPMTTTAAVRRRASVKLDNVVVRKRIDKASPKLMEHCASGKVIPKLELDMVSLNGRSYYKITLVNVRISSVSTNTVCEPECHLVEEVAFTYSKIIWDYKDSSGEQTTGSFDAKGGN